MAELTSAQWVALTLCALLEGTHLTTQQVAEMGERKYDAAYKMLCQLSGCHFLPLYLDDADKCWKLVKRPIFDDNGGP